MSQRYDDDDDESRDSHHGNQGRKNDRKDRSGVKHERHDAGYDQASRSSGKADQRHHDRHHHSHHDNDRHHHGHQGDDRHHRHEHKHKPESRVTKPERHRSRSPVHRRDNTHARDGRSVFKREHEDRSYDHATQDTGDAEHRRRHNRRREERHQERQRQPEREHWGQPTEEPDTEEKPKDKPDFGLSGKLTEDTNTYKGVVIKYSEPPEARKPRKKWRLYPFKGDDTLPVMHIHRQSAFLFGRDRRVADLPVDHPSCSKQHAVLQYRLVDIKREDGRMGRRVKPYVIDLGSANGTYVNNQRIDSERYVELLEKDVVKFGFSSREYVLLHDNIKVSDESGSD